MRHEREPHSPGDNIRAAMAWGQSRYLAAGLGWWPAPGMTYPVRVCAWCETDLSAPGVAEPVLYAREGPPEANWQCLDHFACNVRQDQLLDEAVEGTVFARLFPAYRPGLRGPVAAIEGPK